MLFYSELKMKGKKLVKDGIYKCRLCVFIYSYGNF